MDCSGLWFRVETSSYFRKRGDGVFEFRIKLIPLKKLTCQGCPECAAMQRRIKREGVAGVSACRRGRWYRIVDENGVVTFDGYPAKFNQPKEVGDVTGRI